VKVDNPQNAPRRTVSSDPFIPGEIAERLEAANVQRASLPTSNLVLLGLLGGVYIGFGGALATLVATDTTLAMAWADWHLVSHSVSASSCSCSPAASYSRATI
jgi:formate/nitrite transporter FocA (FNT family)